MKKIAVTGGLASGKTTLCQFFKERSQYVLSADDIVHKLLDPQTDLGKKVISLLGQDVVKNSAFDRARIAQKVFQEENLLQRLEELLHPQVLKVLHNEYKAAKDTYELFVVEVPLLFESGFDKFFDRIILVVADEKKCVERFRGFKEEFYARSKRFMREVEKRKRADFVIQNNGSLEDLKQAFEQVYKQLTT